MTIQKAKDVKLVIQPVIGIIVHEYVFEGPCRFGAGETLTLEFDRMVGADGYKDFRANLKKYIEPEEDFEMLDPVSYEITEAFEVTEAMMAALTKSDPIVSACDGFINLDEAAAKLGFRYQQMDIHEFLDQTHEEGVVAPTMPTRRPNFLKKEEIAEIEDLADRMIAGAGSYNVNKAEIVNSLRFYKTAKKMMEHYECNAFTAPCPEMCATTRLDQEHITPCMTHSLLNAEGISSACEFDIPGLIIQILLSSANRSGAYLGNCVPLYYETDGKTVKTFMAPSNDLQEKVNAMTQEERDNLIITYHASINLRMRGYDAEPFAYNIRNYTASGWGPTFRHDFREDKGQVLTMARISPDCKTLFVARGQIVAGTGETMSGCTQGVLFRVKDSRDFFRKQCNVGNHVPMVFGDVFDQIVELGELLGLDVITA